MQLISIKSSLGIIIMFEFQTKFTLFIEFLSPFCIYEFHLIGVSVFHDSIIYWWSSSRREWDSCAFPHLCVDCRVVFFIYKTNLVNGCCGVGHQTYNHKSAQTKAHRFRASSRLLRIINEADTKCSRIANERQVGFGCARFVCLLLLLLISIQTPIANKRQLKYKTDWW